MRWVVLVFCFFHHFCLFGQNQIKDFLKKALSFNSGYQEAFFDSEVENKKLLHTQNGWSTYLNISPYYSTGLKDFNWNSRLTQTMPTATELVFSRPLQIRDDFNKIQFSIKQSMWKNSFGFGIQNLKNAQILMKESSESFQKAQKILACTQALSEYLELYFLQKTYFLILEKQKIYLKNLELTRNALKNLWIQKTEAENFEIDYLNFKLEKIEIDSKIKTNQENLKKYNSNLNLDQLESPKKFLEDFTKKISQFNPSDRHPELEYLQKKSDSLQSMYRYQESFSKPELNLLLDSEFNQNPEFELHDLRIGFFFSWPIFDPTIKLSTEISKIESEKLNFQSKTEKINQITKFNFLKIEIDALKEKMPILEMQKNKYDSLLQVRKNQFLSGQIDYLRFLQAQKDWNQSLLEELNTEKIWSQKILDLMKIYTETDVFCYE